MTFHVGQKVVCVNAGLLPGQPPYTEWDEGEALVEGKIYTVRRCFVEDGRLILWLDEVARSRRARLAWGNNVGYGACRFRPLIELKTDISIFKRILERPDMEIVS